MSGRVYVTSSVNCVTSFALILRELRVVQLHVAEERRRFELPHEARERLDVGREPDHANAHFVTRHFDVDLLRFLLSFVVASRFGLCARGDVYRSLAACP